MPCHVIDAQHVPLPAPLGESGRVVKADETFIGRREAHKHADKRMVGKRLTNDKPRKAA
jgi:hypothetical protein